MHNNVNQMLSINEKNKQEILYPKNEKHHFTLHRY